MSGPVKEVLAISTLIAVEPSTNPKEENKEMIDFFNRNFDKEREEAFNPMGDDDDEDDKAIENSKREQNYAKQFLDYEEQFDAALLKSTEQL
jgi:hypothetical protein